MAKIKNKGGRPKKPVCKMCGTVLKGRQKMFCSVECRRKKGNGVGGNPTVVTDKVIKELKRAFSIDCNIREACDWAKISVQVYHGAIKRKPELVEEFEECKRKLLLKARNTIAGNMKDPKTAKWYLERKHKKEFSTRQEVEDNTKQRPININLSEYGKK